MAVDPRVAARSEELKKRWTNRMEGDFAPGYTPESHPTAEQRVANAIEYAAYQLGKVSQSLAKITAMMEEDRAKKSND